MRRHVLLLLFFTCCVAFAKAQHLTERLDSIIPKRRIAGKLDSIITAHEVRKKYDTAYILRPKENWTLRMRINGSHWKIRSVHNDAASTIYESNMKYTVAFGIGYRGVMMSLSLNPSKILGKNTDQEYSLVSYGNKFGGEIFFHRSSDFKATAHIDDRSYDTSDCVDKISMFNASAYYAFNSKRFSYPAAFCQSYIQRMSAGSWLLGLDVFYADGHIYPMEEVGISETNMRMFMCGIGGGYGYNFVFHNNWLCHLSAVPTVVVAHRNMTKSDGYETRMSYKFPELLSTGRISIIHSFSKYFLGASGTFQLNTIGNHSDFFMENLKWKARLFVGVRL